MGWIEVYVTEVPNSKLDNLANVIEEAIENMLEDDIFVNTQVDSSRYLD